MTLETLDRDILSLFSARVRGLLKAHFASRPAKVSTVMEIRLRKGLPISVVDPEGDTLLNSDPPVCDSDIEKTLALVTDSSYYALENEFANGYITIPGGHRVGLTGQVVTWGDGTVRLREVSGFNFRIAREVKGAGEKLVPKLIGKSGRLVSTLIISPPGCGKTTLLRDLCRISGQGAPELGLRPSQVGIVDERSEIAACFRGVPQHDVGPRADVLDRCPKARGIMMLLRSMGPDLIVTDEIGSQEDAQAVAVALAGGASVLATCHGDDLEQVRKRPYSAWVVERGYFQKAVVLSRRLGPGTLEYVGEMNR
ncbi:MAG: stage III sporulation protein AA [Bacillota bacterium]